MIPLTMHPLLSLTPEASSSPNPHLVCMAMPPNTPRSWPCRTHPLISLTPTVLCLITHSLIFFLVPELLSFPNPQLVCKTRPLTLWDYGPINPRFHIFNPNSPWPHNTHTLLSLAPGPLSCPNTHLVDTTLLRTLSDHGSSQHTLPSFFYFFIAPEPL